MRVKFSIFRDGMSLSWKMLVSEVWNLTFCESLVENVPFGSLDFHLLCESRGLCSFWGEKYRTIEWASALVLPTLFFSFSELRMELLLLLLQRVEPKLGGMLM